MPRLLVEGRWFDAVSSRAFRELEYQALIRENAASLFPGLTFVPFHCPVEYDGIRNAADFAVIDPEYRRWWVIEVELSHHSLEWHVLPQVESFANATYGPHEATWLAKRDPSLDELALRRMMQGVQPEVLVVVNSPRPEWGAELRPWAQVMVVEVFRSDKGRLIFRQNGASPKLPGEEVSLCRVDPIMPRTLIVESPAPLLSLEKKTLVIEYEGESTDWKLIEAADTVWLSPKRAILPPRRYFSLVRLPEDRLGFVPSDPPRRR